MVQWKKWIAALTGVVLVAAGLSYAGLSLRTATTVVHYVCAYYDNNGMAEWCSEELIGQAEIHKCEGTIEDWFGVERTRPLYWYETNNNPCADVLVSGGAGFKFNSRFVKTSSADRLEKCGIPLEVKARCG